VLSDAMSVPGVFSSETPFCMNMAPISSGYGVVGIRILKSHSHCSI